MTDALQVPKCLVDLQIKRTIHMESESLFVYFQPIGRFRPSYDSLMLGVEAQTAETVEPKILTLFLAAEKALGGSAKILVTIDSSQ